MTSCCGIGNSKVRSLNIAFLQAKGNRLTDPGLLSRCVRWSAEFSAKLRTYLRKLNTVLNLPWIVPVSTGKVRADRETLKSASVRLWMEQAQLAEAAGLTRTTLSHFENGKTAPHDSTREAIQQALELRGIVFTNGDRPGFYFDKTKVTIPAS